MSSIGPESMREPKRQGDDWRGAYSLPVPQRESGGPPWGLIVTGLVVVGLGYMALSHLGPDLRRYIKMSNM